MSEAEPRHISALLQPVWSFYQETSPSLVWDLKESTDEGN